MNAHVNFASTASAIALAGANVVAFRPRPEPEIITGLGQYRAGAGAIVTDWHATEEDAIAEFEEIADEIEAATAAVMEHPDNADAMAELDDEDREAMAVEIEDKIARRTLPTSAVVERAALTRALDIVCNVVEARNTIPILSNACLAGDGDFLAVTATDLDISITVDVPAAVDSAFATTLPAKTLRDLLKKATPSEHVAFTDHRDGHATADFERVNYKLQTLPASDFPDLTAGEFSHSFTLPGAALWGAIDATMAAISTEETRYYLNGIYMHVAHDGALRMVSTDGHRLYRQDLEAPAGCEGMPGIIIPRKTVALLHKLLKGKACPDSVTIELSESAIRFQWDDVTLTSKLVDGTFPDYHRVIPTGNDKPATFDPEAMLEAVRAVTLILSERGRAVKMSYSAGNCQLAVNNPDAGSASADIACDFDSDPVEIGFNAGYLVDAIPTASPDGGSVTLTLADAGSPTLITGSRKGWLGVLMPMRV